MRSQDQSDRACEGRRKRSSITHFARACSPTRSSFLKSIMFNVWNNMLCLYGSIGAANERRQLCRTQSLVGHPRRMARKKTQNQNDQRFVLASRSRGIANPRQVSRRRSDRSAGGIRLWEAGIGLTLKGAHTLNTDEPGNSEAGSQEPDVLEYCSRTVDS